MNFNEQIKKIRLQNNSMVCVGLDPFLDKMPDIFQKTKTGIFDFNKEIINATFDQVCCYKPQFAHYAALGELEALRNTIQYIKLYYYHV